MTIDYGRKRATDCKHNTNIRLPGPRCGKTEQEIEFRRVAWGRIYDDFRNELTDEEGVQESNLTLGEVKGLKKLKKRVQDGEIIIVKTDKSGKFAIMSLEEGWRSAHGQGH